jgi:4'-phosphopantetheinyl transferase
MMTPHEPIDLWYVFVDKIDAQLSDEYLALLPHDERQQIRRFSHEPSRRQSLASRVLMRTVLASYLGEDPWSLRFHRNKYGKPSLEPPSKPALEFNLSHTHGLVVCAVTRQHALGVDVEPCQRRTDYLGLARRFFARPEITLLEQRTPAEQPRTFIELWTLKEAFIKARGMGLSLPLDSFAFELAPGQTPKIELLDRSEGGARDWQFAQLEMKGEYQMALAVERPASTPLVIRLCQTLPLRWQEAVQSLPYQAAHRWTVSRGKDDRE